MAAKALSAAQQDRADARRSRRAKRYSVRRQLRGYTNNKRVAACGKPGRREDGSVTLKLTEGRRRPGGPDRTAGLGGLFVCGNVWLCPECSVKIASARATELEQVMGHFVERGGTVDLITLTMKHNKGQRLKACWDGVSAAWRAVTSGGAWVADQKRLDVAGFARSIEVTHGFINGWHVHAHVIMIYKGQPSLAERTEMAEAMFNRWKSSLVGSGFEAPEKDKHGLDVQHLDWAAAEGKRFESVKNAAESLKNMAKYVTKGLATEATLGAQKTARNGNRAMMALLQDAVLPHQITTKDGRVLEAMDETALELWHEYEKASKAKKQMTWAKRLLPLRKLLSATAELSDEQVADTDLEGETIAVLPRRSFDVIESRVYQLLDATEIGGRAGAFAWLEAAGIEWHRPTLLTDAATYEFHNYEDRVLLQNANGSGGKATRSTGTRT